MWKRASSLGHSLSTYQLAVCYINGYGVEVKDVDSGLKLMEESADAGCAEAQFYLASLSFARSDLRKGEEYLLKAVRKKEIFHKVSGWLTLDSLPAHVRTVVQSVIEETGVKF